MLLQRASAFADRTAIVDAHGTWTYGHLLRRSASLASLLLDGSADLRGARVLLLALPAGFDHVAAQWAVWRAGGVLVPLSIAQPPAEWAHCCDDAQPSLAMVEPQQADALLSIARERGIRLVPTTAGQVLPASRPRIEPDRPALMLYTSGTTSRPKGVVLTHANIQAQVECLTQAWGWREDDRIPLVLPLNHVHGLINVVACALWSGAACEVPTGFQPVGTWERLASGDLTVFMAVPAIYVRLIETWQAADPDTRVPWSAGAARLRVMVSGSAALPVTVLETWRAITGHTLLERYGMTEIGMALSNPLEGERRPGFVGVPLPGVEVRLLDEHGGAVDAGAPGEIHVHGPGVFREYWHRPIETAAAFRADGWFRTGDVAVVENGMYRILGRLSVDIIKTGGEKVSALEIEAVLREHDAVADCAVVGIRDARWGECVSAAVVLRPNATLDLAGLRDWARSRLAGARLPRRLLVVDALPKNAMGKVSKPGVIQMFDPA